MNKRASLAALSLAVLAAAGPAIAADTVSLALPVVSLTVAPTYIADEMGYWKEQGLDMKFPYIAGVGSNNALTAGSVDFAYTSGPTMIRGNARDQKTVAIATTLNRVQLEVVLSKAAAQAAGITAGSPMEKKAQALKGRTMAVDSVNSVVHSFLRYVARKGGVDPERDIKITSMQGPAALAAIKGGSIDGFTMSLPWPLIPVHDGTAIRLASGPRGDFPDLQPFAYITVVARPDYCGKNPSICERLVAGFAKALPYMREHPKESMEILKKRIPSNMSPEVFAEAYELVRLSTPASPRVEPPSLAKAQDYMIATGMMKEEERLPSVEKVINNTFVK
jgi:ABC-type nitrate/sulfonate/bicarbonate transport system substrate-binding protein